jgi:hypothetical protein
VCANYNILESVLLTRVCATLREECGPEEEGEEYRSD